MRIDLCLVTTKLLEHAALSEIDHHNILLSPLDSSAEALNTAIIHTLLQLFQKSLGKSKLICPKEGVQKYHHPCVKWELF